MSGEWQDGSVVDVRAEMLLLALRIVGKTLFDTNVEQEVHKIAAAVDAFMGFLPLAFLPFPRLIQSCRFLQCGASGGAVRSWMN